MRRPIVNPHATLEESKSPHPKPLDRPPGIFHPQFAGLVHISSEPRPEDDEAATFQVTQRMAEYAREDSSNPIVRRAAHEAVQANPALDPAEAVFYWIRDHVRFQEDAQFVRHAGIAGIDPESAEVLVRPVDLLTMPEPTGDCDDFSMLCAAMLRALGIESKFRTIAADRSDPSTYSHVFVVARMPYGELPLDTSHGSHPGWAAKAYGKSRDWSIEPAIARSNLSGLGLADWAQDLLKVGANAGAYVVKERYGVPPAGTVKQTATQTVQRFDPYTQFGATNGSGWLMFGLFGLGAVALVLAMTGDRR